MALKVLIADDDAGMRLVLRKLIESMEGFELAGEAADGAEAVRLCGMLKPDVVFIDVKMPVLSGDEAAKQIYATYPDIAIIFVSAYSEYMPQAFEVYAFDYLLKPFKTDRVRQTLRRLQKRQPQFRVSAPKSLMIKNRDQMIFVPVDDIIIICRENRTTLIVTKDETYTTSESLNLLMGKLNNSNFFRSHRAYILNISYISRIYPYGRWTYLVEMKGTKRDALITSEKLQELESLLSG
ncbi:MAG: response regulator transcription factor [Clostridiales bacterium]|nr:response regulator transcription factor [Clostridiales bacterium]